MRTEDAVQFEVVLSMNQKREALRQPLLRIARLGGPRGEGIRSILPKWLWLQSGSISGLPRALRPDQADRGGKEKKTVGFSQNGSGCSLEHFWTFPGGLRPDQADGKGSVSMSSSIPIYYLPLSLSMSVSMSNSIPICYVPVLITYAFQLVLDIYYLFPHYSVQTCESKFSSVHLPFQVYIYIYN